MFLLCEYIKYKLICKGKYSIHSPFVYDFVSKCLSQLYNKEDKILIACLNEKLKTDQSAIEFKDFGAGSKKLKSTRKVNEIHKSASSKGVYSKLLYQLNAFYKFDNALEMGTSLGVGTLNLHLGNTNCKITTIDASKETQKIAEKNLRNYSNLKFVNLTFLDFFKSAENIKFDFVFIDGHHDGEALLNYMKTLKNFTHNDTIFLIDDIRWSRGMKKAWNDLVSSSDYHLSLDLFRMGILIKRPQQEKEHFVIKIKGILKGMI